MTQTGGRGLNVVNALISSFFARFGAPVEVVVGAVPAVLVEAYVGRMDEVVLGRWEGEGHAKRMRRRMSRVWRGAVAG